MPRGAYIHIPFCEHICHYCDFNKVFIARQPVDAYLQALREEMAFWARKHAGARLQTIYIGGGTPTALSEAQLQTLLQAVEETLMPISDLQEFTVEANPQNLNSAKLHAMLKKGVNRLSLGVQAFDDDLLAAVGRVHTTADVQRALELARRAGFSNISVDLMYRLPGQTLAHLRTSLDAVRQLNIPHVSIYSLQVEPRTIFYNKLRKGMIQLPTEDEEADMFSEILAFMKRSGYKHYEIGNFARNGYESRHNLLYWNNEEYYGFGAGAHGYFSGRRRVNARPVKKYIRLIHEKRDAVTEEIPVSWQEKMENEMMLGLRKRNGVRKSEFEKKFGRPPDQVFGEQLHDLFEKGLLEEDKETIRLTERGLFLGNEVFQQFVSCL